MRAGIGADTGVQAVSIGSKAVVAIAGRMLIPGALLLTACATHAPEPVVRTVEVKVPVPVQVKVPVKVPCAARVAPKPRYADQDAAAQPDVFGQVRALMAGIEQRAKREQELEAAITSCGGKVR